MLVEKQRRHELESRPPLLNLRGKWMEDDDDEHEEIPVLRLNPIQLESHNVDSARLRDALDESFINVFAAARVYEGYMDCTDSFRHDVTMLPVLPL